MESARLEPDEETSLMISVLCNLKIPHRITFEGKKHQGITQLLYKCRLEVAPGARGGPWFEAETLNSLLVWLREEHS